MNLPNRVNRSQAFTLLLFVLLTAAPYETSAAQKAGRVEGSIVLSASGAPLPGVQVVLEGTSIGAITDDSGHFVLARVPAGSHTLSAHFVGLRTESRRIDVAPGDTVHVHFALLEEAIRLQDVVVSATGERQDISEVPVSIGSIDRNTIDHAKPAHPSELMNRISGVWVNTTSGEGHMTAIRQPLTTDPVYLFLENGVPTRSTGFFNHNALYEINVPMAERIEVIKGPGTALYGSDAIGAVINLVTRRPTDETAARLSVEGGAFGFGRLMLGTGGTYGRHGLRADVNATKSDGWRDASRYDRQSGTLRWEVRLPGASRLTTVASASHIDQAPAGASALSREEYLENPTLNHTPISYRTVNALRLSSAFEHVTARSLIQITPYMRRNEMEMIPNWSLTYDPVVSSTSNYSVGVLSRYRFDLGWMDSKLITGADLEISPGTHHEITIEPERQGRQFISFSEGEPIYDYDVTFRQASPYVHAEISPATGLRATAGLRLDVLAYSYDNHLNVVQDGPHRRAASTTRSFLHTSPKLGVTYRLGSAGSIYASYAHAFRVPSEGQLFRQGASDNTFTLDPVKADNLEAGLRFGSGRRLEAELSVYRMIKTDDIVTFTAVDGLDIVTNAGRTSHRGIESGLTIRPLAAWTVRGNLTYAVHRFETWQPSFDLDFSGNWMDSAPRIMANVIAVYEPAGFFLDHVSLEWTRLGSYWMDPANTVKYEGHHLINLRGHVDLPAGFSVSARLMNVANVRFADRATYNGFRGEELAPGLPRALYVGMEYRLGAD